MFFPVPLCNLPIGLFLIRGKLGLNLLILPARPHFGDLLENEN